MSDWHDMARENCILSEKLVNAECELADAHKALEQAHNDYNALRELKETLASHLQMRVDADIALENKWARILALAADWRKE